MINFENNNLNVSNDNMMIKKYLPMLQTSSGSSSDFGDFISKSLVNKNNGLFSIIDKEQFFMEGVYYNPFKDLAYVLKTDSRTLDMPRLNGLSCGTQTTITNNPGFFNNAELVVPNNAAAISIKMMDCAARVQMNRSTCEKIIHTDYLKNILGKTLASWERKYIVNGILNAATSTSANNFTISMHTPNGNSLIDRFIDFKQSLKPEYCANAAFIMSSNKLNELYASHADFKLKSILSGYNQLLGSSVHIVDELADTVLYGDFKQGMILAEPNEDTIKCIDLYDSINDVGVVYSSALGVAVVDDEAIKAIVLV